MNLVVGVSILEAVPRNICSLLPVRECCDTTGNPNNPTVIKSNSRNNLCSQQHDYLVSRKRFRRGPIHAIASKVHQAKVCGFTGLND